DRGDNERQQDTADDSANPRMVGDSRDDEPDAERDECQNRTIDNSRDEQQQRHIQHVERTGRVTAHRQPPQIALRLPIRQAAIRLRQRSRQPTIMLQWIARPTPATRTLIQPQRIGSHYRATERAALWLRRLY